MIPAKLIARSAILTGLVWCAPAMAEELPWANQPAAAPQATLAPSADQATLEAAQEQCASLFEAACRELKTCSWVGEVALSDGTMTPQRCVARPPAPPKAAKKTPKAPAVKKEAATAPAAPAVKAAVTRAEDAEAPAPKKAHAEPKPVKQAAPTIEVTPPAVDKPIIVEKKADPVPEAKVEATAKEEAPAEPAEKAAAAEPKKTETKSPIAVKPSQPEGAKMPSFGSIAPIMPGSESNAVVVTVPSSQ
jgi:hypothetical protein